MVRVMSFKIGDEVICNDPYCVDGHGIIITLKGDNEYDGYGVDVSSSLCKLPNGKLERSPFNGHSLMNRLYGNTGRWFFDDSLKLSIEPEWDKEDND